LRPVRPRCARAATATGMVPVCSSASSSDLTNRSDLDLIIANPDGSPLLLNSVSSTVSRLCRRLGLPKGASLHVLRHSHASLLLADGVDLATVSARLGHSSVRTTADIYSHAIPRQGPRGSTVLGRDHAEGTRRGREIKECKLTHCEADRRTEADFPVLIPPSFLERRFGPLYESRHARRSTGASTTLGRTLQAPGFKHEALTRADTIRI